MSGSNFRYVVCLVVAFVAFIALAAHSTTSHAAGIGGASVPGAPKVDTIRCESSSARPCPPAGAVAPGGELRVLGDDLDTVERIVFRGGRGTRDDVAVRPRHARAEHLEATVPTMARTGPIAFVTKLDENAVPGPRVTVTAVPPRDIAPGRGYFLAGRRAPSYVVEPSASAARVELVDEADGTAVRSWDVEPASEPTTLRWDGMLEDGPAASGSYRFRLGATGPVSSAIATASRPFQFYDHVFPIRGRHDLGQSATNNFGGGRGHQGQDMFARCGVPLAAAQGGVVKRAGTGGNEGNYVVITGQGGDDYVYMHMNATPLVSTGEKVFTGQAIGAVGDTGNASGCHLHFELWRSPGWWSGGSPFDALPLLRAWDELS